MSGVTSAERLRAAWGPILIGVVALLLRVVELGRDDFWSDEVHTFDAIAMPLGDLVVERLAAGHQPLYFLGLSVWSDWFGASEAALRAPSALAGVLLLWPAFLLLRRLADRSTALWGTALLAVHPLMVELSREARMYPFLLLVVIVAVLEVLRAFRTGRVSVLFWCAMVVGPLLHATWGLAIVPLTVWVVWEASLDESEREREMGRARRALLFGCALSMALLIAGVFIAARAGDDMARRVWWEEGLVYVLRQVGGAGVIRSHALVYAAALVAWAGAVWLGWRSVSPRGRRFAGTLFVGVHLLLALTALGVGVAWGPVRYVQVATLPVVFLAGAAISSTRQRDRLMGHALAWGLFGLAGILLALRFLPERTTWSHEAADVHAAEDDSGSARARALREAPDAGARMVLQHYLEHPRPSSPALTDRR